MPMRVIINTYILKQQFTWLPFTIFSLIALVARVIDGMDRAMVDLIGLMKGYNHNINALIYNVANHILEPLGCLSHL